MTSGTEDMIIYNKKFIKKKKVEKKIYGKTTAEMVKFYLQSYLSLLIFYNHLGCLTFPLLAVFWFFLSQKKKSPKSWTEKSYVHIWYE